MFIKTMCYYFWHVFNPIYLSPLYLAVSILLELYLLRQTSVRKRTIFFLNILTFYLNISMIVLLEYTVGFAIGKLNVFHHFEGTRVISIPFCALSLIKMFYYCSKVKNNKKETIMKLTIATIAIIVTIIMIEQFVLTGHKLYV